MIREFNQQWEKDYVRKTAETLEAQAARRKSAAEQNAQREDIDEAMGEGGGDEEEDGECEDGYEDGHGSAGAAKRPGTQRRKLRSFYFRTGALQDSMVFHTQLRIIFDEGPGKHSGVLRARENDGC